MKFILFVPILVLFAATSTYAASHQERSPTSSTPYPQPTPTYRACGGFRITPLPCPKDDVCIDDPRSGGCGMACDAPGICVKDVPCKVRDGKRSCSKGMICVDDPRVGEGEKNKGICV
ncbi:hypothetical protein NA57DRAFT_62198 [Rhizodiscina lignyota]|uniref:Uncharacterized protein n=1 Tax=Rhizodiscina lignyota TaxID=1504668 RepID=A0A9P4I5X2_9PEZI|nr:hypothetical protein NA57DRAFT_62198 [Rhizodiscina lignyota]